ncbi:GNAT family N-acetyltransferase [Desulfitobacterium chlororespirans]|uniref:Acetyltransferase (GNAT) family protein n=1 Tax=Desulfitobacterium chlororespirans DSM 11544 TaxID=1121395 RepID=A0A1M7SBW1_9FIRM|nr:GNAT family N-acetyltransferase [Desulfitobacterium chlororespirans]SHN55991.1 Acetyltransferase (GNAT) family protein [Desulfitobacterium chlororespirans DSM 11544]
MTISYRMPAADELEKISEQIMMSYLSAYQGLMAGEYLSSLQADHWVSILQEGAGKGDTCLIAESEGKIIGSTVFSVVKEGKDIYGEWHAFYLLPEYIGLGVGHSFYQRIEEEMLKQGCNYCLLEVLSSNQRAIRFYLSHGFTKTETFTVQEYGMILSCDKMRKDFKGYPSGGCVNNH